MANRLSEALSPYLRQHADNPVDWWQWCDEAFEEAVRRDVPVLLSVGYAACHWCHVMAHESFEDPEMAALMNDRFVSIKVDREERPDVDATYMAATTAMTGHGGWPMTVFLDHERRPFYAGTYYPPEPRAGMPSFRLVLEAVSDAWRDRRDRVEAAASQIAAGLRAALPEARAVDEVWPRKPSTTCGPVSTPGTVVSGGRRNSRSRWCTSSCCVIMGAPGTHAALRWSTRH